MRLSRGWLKLRRDIAASRWQFLAVAVVIALGVAIFIGAYGSYQNLRSSYDRSYDELRMADLWFEVGDAPAALEQDVAAVEGVAATEGRLVEELPIVLPEAGPERMLGRFVTLPAERHPAVNDVKVTKGQYFSPQSGEPQVLLEDGFAKFHDAEPGDRLRVMAPDGVPVELNVAGVAVSPEYLWVAKSERELFTLPSTFGIVFVPYDELAALLGTEPGIGARRIDERHHRQAEPAGHLHEPESLAVALRMRHAEGTMKILLGVAPLLVPDDHDRPAVQTRHARNDRRIVGVAPIAVQLGEAGGDALDVVEGVRAQRVTSELHPLPAR